VLAERGVVRDRFVDLRAETVRTASGAVLDPYWVMHLPELVVVVAVTPDDHLVLVRQWRQGCKAWVLELPGGIIDPGETDPCAAGARELLEETGYAAPRSRLLAAYWTDPARNSNRLHVVLAEGAVPSGPTARDAGEEMSTVLLPLEAVLAELGQGSFGHGLHIGAVTLALAALGRPPGASGRGPGTGQG